ncbi:hypothetical protein HPB50_002345 [Hyalomma asiaticum]|uniref:Uncharacterized protein n=1 Tax=Hyalomma asiaticum TaxID=266040 RepID=A0ACB7TBA0_HYAAI|nr:hypothetical protein HPB50_002345 [Hyalomma asiaticum]
MKLLKENVIMLTRANEVLNRKVAELVAALDKSNKEVMALKIGLPGRLMPTQQLAEERQCERRQQQLPHQQAERAQTPAPAALQTMAEETVEDETTTAAAGPAPKRRATESLKERRINERLNRMEEQHNATINASNGRFANIDSTQQIMAALQAPGGQIPSQQHHPPQAWIEQQQHQLQKKAVLQQHLEQTTVRPDVIVLQETLAEEVKLPGYKASVSPPSLRGTTGSTGRGACTLVRKGITLEHEVLGTNSPIEHTFIEVVTGKKGRKESTFILNVYSSPAHRKQKFKALLHKANRIASPSNRPVVCGDFNAPNEAWGYGRTLVKGRDLLQDATDLALTLITDPADPTRIGNSVTRDTTPDLAFVRSGGGVNAYTGDFGWRNTGHELGSDHYIVEIAVPLSNGGTGINFSNSVRTHRVTDWDAFRGALPVEKVVIEDIEEWTAGLTERATAAHILWDCVQNPREARTMMTIPPWLMAAAGSDQLEEQTVDFDCPRKATPERNRQVPATTSAQGQARVPEKGGSSEGCSPSRGHHAEVMCGRIAMTPPFVGLG